MAALPHLTLDDLKELGLPMGPRKIAAAAIAAMEHTPTVAPPTETQHLLTGQQTAERRQLTVLFCDLVGSTALSGQLDAEDLRELIRAYQNLVAGEIARYEGHVAKFMGDGVMAYFGYPRAHEDDPERAIHSGLAIVDAINELDWRGSKLQVRLGIATGQVVVGDIAGEVAYEVAAAIGETPNLAARLQTFAKPNDVVIADTTYELVGRAFKCSDLGAPPLKGIGRLVRAWRVDGTNHLESRFQARAGPMTRFVGREHEVGILLERWRRSVDGEGQVVLLSGEAGLGKSRILDVMFETLKTESHIRATCQCSPYRQNSALHPVIDYLERTAGFSDDDRDTDKLAKLEELLTATSDDTEQTAPLLATLMSLQPSEHHPRLEMSPQLRKARTLIALADYFVAQSRTRPTLILFEDAHWIDPTTLEFLEVMIDRVAGKRVLLIVTFRPEFVAPWQRYPHVSTLELTRLSAAQCKQLATHVSARKALPTEVMSQIVEKTDGVPLFVEELTKEILESDLLRETADRYELSGLLPPIAIPNTLQDSLMARLDRLGSTRELAQIGAVIGREFPYKLIRAVAQNGNQPLSDGLSQLVDAELVFRHGQGENSIYIFKHALVQDVAYKSLLRSRRQELHTSVAETLKAEYPGVATAEPELLAYHYTEAGLIEKALPFHRAAARNALRGSALPEALGHLTSGLKLLETLPETPGRDSVEIEYQALLGSIYVQARGNASPEAAEAYGRAYEICQRADNPSSLFPILWGVWLVKSISGQSIKALEIAEEMLNLAGEDKEPSMIAHVALTASNFWAGRYSTAGAHIKKALALYAPEMHEEQFLAYSFDMKLTTLVYGSQLTWILGYPEQALALKQEMDTFCEELKNPFMSAFVHCWGATVLDYVGDREGHLRQVQKAREISVAVGLPFFVAQSDFWIGWDRVLAGDFENGIALMKEGLLRCQATGAGAFDGIACAYLGLALVSADEPDEAEECIQRGLERVSMDGLRPHEAELLRARGELHVVRGDLDAAEESFRDAISVARRENAKSWELRASISLSRLLMRRNDRATAKQILTPIHNWFTEGFDTPDLTEARSLLDGLK